MTNFCRLCLFESDSCVNVLSTDKNISVLLPKIVKYLHFEIKDDIYSKTVCQKCINYVEEFDIYFNKVSANQQLLHNMDIIDASITKVSEIIHVTEYSIKTENGICTLEPTIPERDNTSQTVNDTSSIIDLTLNNDQSPSQHQNDTVSFHNNQPSNSILSISANKVSKVNLSKKLTKKSRRKTSLNIETKYKKEDNQKILSNARKRNKIVDNENVANYVNHNNSIDEDDYDLDGYYSDIDVNLYEKNELIESNVEINNYDNCNEKFIGFPKVMIKNSKLIYRGKTLLNLMSKFYRLECNLCMDMDCKLKPTFECLSNLFTHYADNHSVKGYVICCGTKLSKPNPMAMHMSRHLQPDAFQCALCEKMMTCPKILQYHVQNHLPENQRPLACPDCPRKFSYSSALIAHSILHLPENERKSHICDECGKSFLSSGRLSTHINVVHCNRGQEFICHICAKQFSCRSNLIYHLTTHQPRIHQVQCSKCNKWLKNKLCLRKHMVQHSEIRFKCDICDYSSFNRQCLRNHIKVQHSDAKPFSCQHCGKTFKLRNTLINHMVQHTGIKRYKCEFCDRSFASSGNYYSHRKRMHKDELAAVNKKKEEDNRLLRQESMKKE